MDVRDQWLSGSAIQRSRQTVQVIDSSVAVKYRIDELFDELVEMLEATADPKKETDLFSSKLYEQVGKSMEIAEECISTRAATIGEYLG